MIVANMDTVGTFEMATKLSEVHRIPTRSPPESSCPTHT